MLALSENPNIFFSYSCVEDERRLTNTDIQKRLEQQTFLGAFHDEILVGMFGFRLFEVTKLSHRGMLFDMYVHPNHQNSGIANRLLDAMLEIAKQQVIQVHVSLSRMDKKNFNFYRRYGFKSMATHPRSLNIGEEFYDELIMVLKLDD